MLAESFISDLQAAFPAVRCPTSVLQSCGDEDRTRTGSLQVLGCCSWRGWLSLLAGTASAEDASSFAASVLFCANLISPQVALLPPLWQPGGFMSRKLLQGSGKAVCFPHLGSFSCRCIPGHTAQHSSIPTPPSPSSKTETTERGEEQDDFFC